MNFAESRVPYAGGSTANQAIRADLADSDRDPLIDMPPDRPGIPGAKAHNTEPVNRSVPGRPRRLIVRLMRDQRIAFLGVGAVNTLLGAVFFVALQLTLGRLVNYLMVLLVAHVLSVLCAFVLHRRIVFRVRGNVLRDLIRFEMVYVGGLAVNMVLLPILVEVGHLPVIPAQFLVVSVTAIMSFFGHKYFSFRRRTTS